ncbi:MAG: aminotransferase class I/II-fold pyridoxal phosphate-dependent enzyme [Bdellovibrionales bacterium]|nr:aminotransferase class I/II-fold pyridoxal phosphate-dependent enzyme [Bdellovibrionales bacterium]
MQLRKHKRSLDSFQLSPIKAIELAASKQPGAISLAQGIPSFDTPQVIKDFVYEKIAQGACDKYSLTIGLAELREEIALSLAEDGLSYDPESEILVTVGSIEGITASLMACTDPGDEVILPSPTYASYLGGISMAGCTPQYVSLNEEENFDFDVEKIKHALTSKTRVILYCTPNNPTGTLFSEEKTRALVELAVKHNLIILVDEVYKDFYYTNDIHFSPAQIPEARERLIRACSFSKAYAMTGWRVGFLLAPTPLIQSILKFHDAMVTCAPVVSQYAAIAALRHAEPHRQAFVQEFRKRRDLAIRFLDELSRYLDYQLPKATYFVFPRLKDTVPLAHDSNRLAYDILEKSNVALVPGKAFDTSGESHLRINFGRSEEELKEGLSRFADYLSQKTRSSVTHSPSATPLPTKNPTPSLKRTTISSLLRLAARFYLQKHKPTIIGITGIKGKTVYKRIFQKHFEDHFRTRSSILSYNTEIGLALSILNIESPRTQRDKLLFPLRILKSLFAPLDIPELLILEYGVTNKGDGQRLLSIAQPDWLIVTPIATPDLSINHQEIQSGISELTNKLPSSHILFAGDDPYVQELFPTESDAIAIRESFISNNAIRFPSGNEFPLTEELIGESARLATVSAVCLSEKLQNSIP